MTIEVYYSKEVSIEEPGVVLYLKGDKYLWSDYIDHINSWTSDFNQPVRDNPKIFVKILDIMD